TTSSPDTLIRGTPLHVSATTIAGALAPSGLTMRARTWAPPGVLSTQLTKAFPEGWAMMSTRPSGFPSPTRICELKVAPPSAESATCTLVCLGAAVNHATATFWPADEIAGPFTGQPRISQPSLESG